MLRESLSDSNSTQRALFFFRLVALVTIVTSDYKLQIKDIRQNALKIKIMN